MNRLVVGACLVFLASSAIAGPHKKGDKDDDEDADAVKVTDDDDADAKADDDKPKKKKPKAKDDDTDAKADDDKPAKKKKAKDDDAEAKDDDDRPAKKKHKAKPKADDVDVKDDDKPAKKKRKLTDTDEETATERDEIRGEPTPKAELKAKTEPEPEPEPKAKAKAKGKGKGKGKKQGKTNLEINADEIEMDDTETRAEAAPLPGTEVVAVPLPGAALPANPLSIGDRSLTLAKDRLDVHGGLPISVLTLPGATAGTTVSTTSEGLALGVTYGIDDNAEIGGDYAFAMNPGKIKGPLTLHGAYRVVHDAKLEVAIAGGIAIDFYETTDPMTMVTASSTAFGLQLGAWVRYRVAPKVSLFTGLPATPNGAASLTKLAFPLPPLSYQLALGITSAAPVALELPAGVGIQATPNVYAFATIDLAHIKLANTANAFLFRDFIPIALGGFYSLPKVDIGAVFADDLEKAADYLSFEIMARYAIK
jgi:hypothetical protein